MAHRLHRLEGKLPKPVPQCAGCGYPATKKLIQYIVTRHSNPLPRCPECDKPLAEDGTPIDGHYKRIILSGGDVV